jgi:hypothetical protein
MELIRVDDDEAGPCPSLTGFRALFAAVVERAVRDCIRDGLVTDLEHRQALNWINNPATGVGSLEWFCGWINIDADCVRERVNKSPDVIRRNLGAMTAHGQMRMRVVMREN